MKDVSLRERWDVWMVQAERFARRENYIDALGRARMTLAELDATLAETTDEKERAELTRYRAYVERRMKAIRRQFEEWNAKIAARRAQSMAQADEEMKRPLPYGPDERL